MIQIIKLNEFMIHIRIIFIWLVEWTALILLDFVNWSVIRNSRMIFQIWITYMCIICGIEHVDHLYLYCLASYILTHAQTYTHSFMNCAYIMTHNTCFLYLLHIFHSHISFTLRTKKKKLQIDWIGCASGFSGPVLICWIHRHKLTKNWREKKTIQIKHIIWLNRQHYNR